MRPYYLVSISSSKALRNMRERATTIHEKVQRLGSVPQPADCRLCGLNGWSEVWPGAFFRPSRSNEKLRPGSA